MVKLFCPILQYKIPQNVEIEDKIVAFLTMRHLIICGIGFGIAYVIYISLAKTYYAEVWLPPVIIVSLITVAIAFVEIKHIRFVKWFFLILEGMINPRKRIWDKRQSTQFVFASVMTQKPKTKKEKKKEAIEETKESKLSHLEELTRSLDRMPLVDDQQSGRLASVSDHDLAGAALHGDTHEATQERIQSLK